MPQDPNRLTYNNRQDYWHWQYKFLGSYELPWGISSSASIRMTKGEPYGRTLNTTGLTQGTVNLTVEPIGTFFYPHRAAARPAVREECHRGWHQARRAVRHLQRHQFSGDSQRQHADGRELRQRADDRQPADRQARREVELLENV